MLIKRIGKGARLYNRHMEALRDVNQLNRQIDRISEIQISHLSHQKFESLKFKFSAKI